MRGKGGVGELSWFGTQRNHEKPTLNETGRGANKRPV
jgi:hypothetical protein